VEPAGDAAVTARFDAHAEVAPGDRVEIAVTVGSSRFFDLGSGLAIR
jgi:hypothetical protein